METLSAAEATALRTGPDAREGWRPHPITLAPAKWIWLPSERALPNTFVLFRKEIDLPDLEVVAQTPRGPVEFHSRREANVQRIEVKLPERCEAELWLPAGVTVGFPPLAPDAEGGLKRYRLPAGVARFEMPGGQLDLGQSNQ